MSKRIKCERCGAELPAENRFCDNCGAPVRKQQNETAAAPPEGGFLKRKTVIAIVTAAAVVFAGLGAAIALVGHNGSADYTAKIEEAQKYVDAENFEAAIKTYDEAIAISPKKPEAYLKKADVQIVIGDYPGALGTLEEGDKKAKEKEEIKKKLKTVRREYEGEWKTAYKAVLQDNEYDVRGYENIRNFDFVENYEPYDSTALCDIDGDGVPELFFITYSQDFENNGLHIFKYQGGKAQEISYKVADMGTYKDGTEPSDSFFHFPAGGEESGYIIFMKGDTLTMLNKYTDEHVSIDIDQYRSSGKTSLDMVRYIGFYWDTIANPGKQTVDLSTAEIYTDKGRGTKEDYEKEYAAMCDGMGDVIFCVREGVNTDDEKIWDLAESKNKLSMTYDEMIKELEKVPQKPVQDKADDKVLSELTGTTMSLSSGAGGWSTDIEFKEDGRFIGNYHDSNMGETGPGYPNGTVYLSDFEGKFGSPKKVGEHEYEMTLEDIKVKDIQDEITEDGVLQKNSEPYGFENLKAGDKVRLFAPGYPISNFSEENQIWFIGRGIEGGSLEGYCILNENKSGDSDYDYVFF